MKIMVVGGGGREHALIKALKKNPSVREIYSLPGNGGIAQDALCIPIGPKDINAMAEFALQNGVDFAVVAQDDPLVLGAVDRLEEAGVACFGPNAKAAAIEGSKSFAKNLMRRYGIPTARYRVFDGAADAIAYIKEKNRFPSVIKADGLALGKGVFIAEDMDCAEAAVRTIMEERVFGKSGERVVVEEFLTGPEVSVLCFTDGKAIVPMVSSMDHKRAQDGDLGANTGGMGVIAPNPFYTPAVARLCMERIFLPTMNAMNAEGRTFKGCLYFGLMITGEGPKVIEYNCRFGDPEAQAVLPLMKTDLLTVMRAVSEQRLSELSVEFSEDACCCVIMASGGYPGGYKTGFPIDLSGVSDMEDISVYHAGTKREDGRLLTSGGRVLGVSATAPELSEAIKKAYRAVERVSFQDAFYRTDIGKRALSKKY